MITKNKTSNFKKVIHMDEKVVCPKDKITSAIAMGESSESVAKESMVPKREEDHKSFIGRPRVYDLDGNLLAEEENLVVLTGREFIAQNLVGTQGNNPLDLTNYKITHFGVGDSNRGSTGICPPTTVGPFDDDVDLENRVTISDLYATYPNKYIDNGRLKRIESDGEIKIVSEEHTINVPTGGQKVIDAYTAIRYRMYLQPGEPQVKPFCFNEAGLYAVEQVFDPVSGNSIATDNYVLFARFTTMDKWLDVSDGIMIEWYILV